jgi:DNA polymerase III sliding clamp (beta) subunit (PCNA family)
MKQNRKKVKFNLMTTEYYPRWNAFDPDGLTPTPDIGSRIKKVEWAASSGIDGILTGIYMDGEKAIATDKYRFASFPLVINNMSKPVTIPASVLSSVIKPTGDTRIAVVDGQLHVMPDEHTQIRTIIFGDDYPGVSRVMLENQPDKVTVPKGPFLDMMKMALNMVGSDRNPLLKVYVGREEVAVFLENADTGMLGDVIDVPTQAVHPRCELRFTPKNIIDAVENSPNDDVTLAYDHANTSRPVRIDGGSGYQAWVAMRKESSSGPA